MSRGGYFNNGERRSGGDRHSVIVLERDPERIKLLAILRDRLTAAPMEEEGRKAVFARLVITPTDVLRNAVECDLIGAAESKARRDLGLPEAE